MLASRICGAGRFRHAVPRAPRCSFPEPAEPIIKTNRSVGMIGLGIMGSAMASNLLRAGVAALPSPAAREAVASHLARAPRRGLIVVETSTLPLAAKEAARRALAGKSITLLDCPLSGTGAQARTKDLNVYASGPRAACNACKEVFEGFSRAHYYLGAFGTGIKMKFIANLLVAIHNVAAAEALVLAKKAGLDPALTLQVVSDGAGRARMLQGGGPMLGAGEYRG